MGDKEGRIVVAGDVAVDWLQWTVPGRDAAGQAGDVVPNWALHPGLRMTARPGGALLLARMVRDAAGAPVSCPSLDAPEAVSPAGVLHSNVSLRRYPPPADDEEPAFRVERFGGYAGPSIDAAKTFPVQGDRPDAGLVVLDDPGNGFRHREDAWPRALREGRPLVVLKASRPLSTGPLWELLVREHAGRLIVVTGADDLRAEGLDIGRRLSWERTATDFAGQAASRLRLRELLRCAHLVVRFDLDGVIHCRKGEGGLDARLHADPRGIEGDFRARFPGGMTGLACAFTAALAARVHRQGTEGLDDGIRDGILASRRLLRAGFGGTGEEPDYPGEAIFRARPDDARIVSVPVPAADPPGSPEDSGWTILGDLARRKLEATASDIVVQGTGTLLDRVPSARFGKLVAVDRSEIESFRSIRNLMEEYLAQGYRERPLSIAVFGPPGSGKSFGVTQVAGSIAAGATLPLEFNLSQWESPSDLVRAFHRVRDAALGRLVPLVFFDEFDASLGGAPLGWLKHFLDPMQGGKFRDGEADHPIGKAIFVFAGGTCSTLAEFRREGEGEERRRSFRDAKGPDFVSRLRGYVDILGINPAGEDDRLCLIRRAMLLRSLLSGKAPRLFDDAGKLRVEPGVLRALLKVPAYKHGIRSMEAVLDMSMLAGRRILEPSALPPAAQLDLHVDAKSFRLLLARDALFGGLRERLARAIHEGYLAEQRGTKAPEDPSMQPWDRLPEDLKESNRLQADAIPGKLDAAGYGFGPASGREAGADAFSPEEEETLGRLEHARWMTEREERGYVHGPVRDESLKTHPCMLPWEELPEVEREKDRAAVRAIPALLAGAGFRMYRLE